MTIISNTQDDNRPGGWYQHTDDTELPSLEWIQTQNAIGLTDRYDYRPAPYVIVNGVAIPEGVAGRRVAEWLLGGKMVGCHPVGRINNQWSDPSEFFHLVYIDPKNGQFVYGRYTPPLSPRFNPNNVDPRPKWEWIHAGLDGVINPHAHVFDMLAMWGDGVWSYEFCKIYSIEELDEKFRNI